MSELKPCPFCGNYEGPHEDDCYFTIIDDEESNDNMLQKAYNTRPIEDELRSHMKELEDEIEKLKLHIETTNAMLNDVF